MRPTVVNQTVPGASPLVVLDYLIAPFQVSIAAAPNGAGTFTVEHTYDDPFAPGFNPATAQWFPNAGITGKSAAAEGSYTLPVRAIRLNVASGSAKMTVVQAGWHG